MRQRIQAFWRFFRTLIGEDAYECYIEHHRSAHANESPLSRREFYVNEQQRKWNGIKRCC